MSYDRSSLQIFIQSLFPSMHHVHQLASSSYIVPLCPVAASCMQGTGYSPGVKGHWCKPVQGKNTMCTNWCNTKKPSAKPNQCDTKPVQHHNTMSNARSEYNYRIMPSWCSKNNKLIPGIRERIKDLFKDWIKDQSHCRQIEVHQ